MWIIRRDCRALKEFLLAHHADAETSPDLRALIRLRQAARLASPAGGLPFSAVSQMMNAINLCVLKNIVSKIVSFRFYLRRERPGISI
jgi:hypothetical protein